MTTFDELYHRHVRTVLGLALRLAPRREVAEALTVDAFLALHRSFDAVDPAQLPAWLLDRVAERARAIDGHLATDLQAVVPTDRTAAETAPLDAHAERRLFAQIDARIASARDAQGFRTWLAIALAASLITLAVLAAWFVVAGRL